MSLSQLQKQVTGLGTIMGIWAHPDDEVFMTAGLMAIAVANGQEVVCLTATRGEQGIQDETKWPADRLGDIRSKELVDAYKILGITQHHWLDYPDGGCVDADQDAAIAQVCELVEQYKPDTILTFPPNGSTGHPDHMTVCRWACAAANRCSKDIKVLFSADTQEAYDKYWRELDEQFNIYFNLDKPKLVQESDCDLLLRLTPELSSQKCDALSAMPSQTEAMVQAVGKEELCKILAIEGFVDSRRDISWSTD